MYKINIDKMNKNQLINLNKKDFDEKKILTEKNNGGEYIIKTINNIDKYRNKGQSTKNLMSKYKFYKKLKSINNDTINVQKNFQNTDINNKNCPSKIKDSNNSSYNYLIKSSKSLINPNKVSTNSIQASNEFLNSNDINMNNEKKDNNDNNNNSLNIKNSFKNKKINTLKSSDNDENKSYQDLLLNQPNRSTVLIVKIYIIIILILILLIIILSFIKFKLNLELINGFNRFFNDFTIVLNRFSLLHYYFNIFRTIIILHDDELNNKIEIVLDNMTESYEDYENEYIKVLLNDISIYNEAKNLFIFLKENRNNSTDIIREKICEKEQECINYLNSKYNIFDSGVDFSYKSCISKIKDFYKDYKNLNNKTDIEEIKRKIINSDYSLFNHISLGISNLVIYVKSKIIQCFKNDQIYFTNIYNKKINDFNVISISFSILTILFVNIFIFLTISRFSRPIKESTYRLNCTFYYIKKYSLNNYKKIESIFS